jgi:DNA polymerase I
VSAVSPGSRLTFSNLPFGNLWCVDSEYRGGQSGGYYETLSVCARELRTGRTVSLWQDELGSRPPYGIGPDDLFIAFVAQAELGCHLALGWDLPVNILDLYIEHRLITNGWQLPTKRSLLGALQHYGLRHISVEMKDATRDRIQAGPPFNAHERETITSYCMSDVDGCGAMLPVMLPEIDIRLACHRGQFAAVSARMQFRGVPLDPVPTAKILQPETWTAARLAAVHALDTDQVFEGDHLREARFEDYLRVRHYQWPRREDGKLDLRRKTFKRMCSLGADIERLYRLRYDLTELRRFHPTVGPDFRNRAMLWPFQSRTSRTQPRTRDFLFNESKSLRFLVRPTKGRAISYTDFEAAEFGIGAALSGDPGKIAAYRSPIDTYLYIAKLVGAIKDPRPTKKKYPFLRGVYKVVSLAAQYGITAEGLAEWLEIHPIDADTLLRQDRMMFAPYWQWSDAWYNFATMHGRVKSVFGWEMHLGPEVSERSVRNWPIQTACADILRVACIMADRLGVELLMPMHDAVMIEANSTEIVHQSALMAECMRRASRIVLHGFELDVGKPKIVRWPHRYREDDARAREVWQSIETFLKTETWMTPTASSVK